MSKVICAAAIAAIFAFGTMSGGSAIAQTPPAKDTAGQDSAKAKTPDDRKANAEERKAKRAEAKKMRAEKKAKASAARAAVTERQKECGSEWREARKAGKIEKTMTWPKYWSACNTRLKAKSG